MSLISLIVLLAIIAFLMWAINKYLPMQPTMRTILNVAVAAFVIIWLLRVSGLLDGVTDIQVVN